MDEKYSACDVRAFYTTLTVRCREPKLVNLQFSAGNQSPNALSVFFLQTEMLAEKKLPTSGLSTDIFPP